MQYEVNPMDQSQYNGLWLFFAWIMLIMHNWLIMHGLLTSKNVEKHFALSSFAISDESNQPNLTKRPETSIWALFCISYANKLCRTWAIPTPNRLRLFRNIKIFNMKTSWCTKLMKMAKNQIETQAPLLVVPFLIIFSLGTPQKCFCRHFHHH